MRKAALSQKDLSWFIMDSPMGKIAIAEDGKGICDMIFQQQALPERLWTPGTEDAAVRLDNLHDSSLLRRAAGQLVEYFGGSRKTFDLPLSLHGTPFQLDDWAALLTIPYGETRSYKQIAEQIGRPKAYRAVGMANNRNPISIIIPCHRVIGHDGSLVGYGSGLDHKEYLLQHELRYR